MTAPSNSSTTTTASATFNSPSPPREAPPSSSNGGSRQASPRQHQHHTTTTTKTKPPPKIRRKLIIDTDCGGDDALGILVAAADPDVDIVMLTACWGNCNVIQGVENLGKLVDVIGRDIPIYLGAAGPLLGHERETAQWYGYGQDGFGDAGFAHSDRADQAMSSGKHAALAIVEALSQLPPRQGEDAVIMPARHRSCYGANNNNNNNPKTKQHQSQHQQVIIPEGRTGFGSEAKAARRRSLLQMQENAKSEQLLLQQQDEKEEEEENKTTLTTKNDRGSATMMKVVSGGGSSSDNNITGNTNNNSSNSNKREVGDKVGSLPEDTFTDACQELSEEQEQEAGIITVENVEEKKPKQKESSSHPEDNMEEVEEEEEEEEVIEVWQLVCLGPLTNIAVALQLQPNLFSRLGSTKHNIPGVTIMGGAMQGKGNANMCSEFNFASDPEAARAVFNNKSGRNPLLIVTWELTVDLALPWEMFDRMLGRMPRRLAQMTAAELSAYSMTESLSAFANSSSSTTAMATSTLLTSTVQNPRLQHFLTKLLKKFEETSRPEEVDCGDHERTQDSCVICDAVCVAIAIGSGKLVKETIKTYATVELHGAESRGALLVDWYGSEQTRKKKGRWVNAEVVLKADHDMVNDVISRITVCS